MLDINTEELILIYLEGFDELRNESEVPYGMTPRGIIEGIRASEEETYNSLESLVDDDLVEEDVKSVTGLENKRNVYFLSGKGRKKEENIWDEIKDQKITVKKEDDKIDIKLKKMKNHISGRNPIIEALKKIDDDDLVDITDLKIISEVFVGRNEELDYLKEHLKKVKENGVEFVLIEGEAGIGKTSLVNRLTPFSKELGFEFLSGTCQSEISDPYLPFKEAFDKYLDNKESEKISDMAFIGIGGGERTEDKNIFDANKKKTFYETTKFIKNLSQDNPMVIFLDDLQWVDKATLDILKYIIGKLEDRPVLFIGTYRPEDVSKQHRLMDLKHRLKRKDQINTLVLEPLNFDSTKDTVESILAEGDIPEHFIEIIHEKTDGNPLFIKECIKQMLEDGTIDPNKDKYPEKGDEITVSDLVNDVIKRRINRFDDETKKIMEIGSVIGGLIPFDLLLETSKSDEIDLLDHVDILLGDHLWEEDPHEEVFYFAHDLIEKTVYDEIRDMKKRLLHKRIAECIKNIYNQDLQEWFYDLARHYERGRDYSQALDYYIKAGKKAEDVYANEDAIEMYEKGLELAEMSGEEELDKFEILENIARAYSMLGKHEKSRSYLKDALKIPELSKGKKSKILSKIGENWINQGEYDKALKKIEKGLDIIETDTKTKAYLLGEKGWVFIRRSEYDQAKNIFKEEMNIAENVGDNTSKSQAYHNLGTAYNFLKKFDKGKKYLLKAKEVREKEENLEDLAKTLNNLGVLYENIDIDKTLEYYQESLNMNEKVGNITMKNGLLNNIGRVYYYKGKFEKGIKHLKDSLKIRKRIGDKYGISLSFVNLGLIYAERGELKKAIDYHERSLEIVDELGDNYCKSINLRGLGKIYDLKGDLEKSLDYYQRSLECSKEGGNKAQRSLNYSFMSENYLKKGELDKAEQEAKKALQISKDINSMKENGIAQRMLGRVHNKAGNIDESISRLENSKDKLRKSGFVVELAKTLLYLGKICKQNDENKSEKYLREAEDRFKKSGMKPWLDIIHE